MQFGMFFELQLPRPWAADSEQQLVRDALQSAEIGEQAGIGYAWAQEHHFLEEYSHSTAPEVFLAAVSQRTVHMRVGHGITLMPPPYNHPARVAERIAMLDLVSGGRVEWGTGESSSRIELEAFGVPYIEKRAMWAECVRESAKMMGSTPYPGYAGRYFSMPPRNVVPKPVQHPHPPLWVACTNRESLKLAARLGMGALTFSFMNAAESRFWVKEYYETFMNECQPIGQAVNPNVAMLAGLYVHPDAQIAEERGLRGQQFFKWALAHYYRFGKHVPGQTSLWDEFQGVAPEPMAGIGAVGDPKRVREHFAEMDEAGVDQVIVLQQAANYKHEQICESLELAGREVFGEFIDRHEERNRRKMAKLEPFIERALSRIPQISDAQPGPVVAYPQQWAEEGATGPQVGARRAVDAAALWRVHVGQSGGRVSSPEVVRPSGGPVPDGVSDAE
jgi:alkanesulfonate monooxygenase SsuD/methylene tetrahydromethanopterin reductase-like flavin-dependent oxidoreductase (luciferase family)